MSHLVEVRRDLCNTIVIFCSKDAQWCVFTFDGRIERITSKTDNNISEHPQILWGIGKFLSSVLGAASGFDPLGVT